MIAISTDRSLRIFWGPSFHICSVTCLAHPPPCGLQVAWPDPLRPNPRIVNPPTLNAGRRRGGAPCTPFIALGT